MQRPENLPPGGILFHHNAAAGSLQFLVKGLFYAHEPLVVYPCKAQDMGRQGTKYVMPDAFLNKKEARQL